MLMILIPVIIIPTVRMSMNRIRSKIVIMIMSKIMSRSLTVRMSMSRGLIPRPILG
jgi:hypothetical protein